MRAGAARMAITPPVGTELSGFVAREQPSVGLLDDLYARALYLRRDEPGGEKLLWLHCDVIGFTRADAERLRKQLCEKLSLESRQVLLSATHTHSGPATVPLRECGRIDPGYMEAFGERLRAVAETAAAEARPVTLRFGEGRCTLGADRRKGGPHSHADHRAAALAVVDADGRALAVLANYGMHNVALSSRNRLISADVAGAAARSIRQHLPGEPVVLMANGACGNVDPPEQSPDPSLMRGYGRELGGAILAALETPETWDPADLATAMETLELPLTVLSADEVRQRHERAVAAAPEDNAIDRRIRRAMRQWRDETLALPAGGAPRTVSTDLQVLRIGRARFAAVGAEVFSRMGDELRDRVGPRTYVIGCANGLIGYLPHREIYAEGGYEADEAYMYCAHFMLAPGGYEAVRDRAAALLRSLPPTAGEPRAAPPGRP